MDLLTSFLHRVYQSAQRRHPEVLYRGDESIRQIALTFDDGPHPRDTPHLLKVLEMHRVRATFHLLGENAERHLDMVRHIHLSGHQLALHGYRHLPFPLEQLSALHSGLERTRGTLAEIAGVSPASIRDLRPPYGLFSARMLTQFKEWGYRLVMWSCIPAHWMQPVGWSIHQVMQSAVPGVVIVLHDGHGHGTRVAEIVDAIVPQLQALGLEFVTVEEMQAQRRQTAPRPHQDNHHDRSSTLDPLDSGKCL